jgi:hypothetical protein
MLRTEVPQLRTTEAILTKNEQILDGMERGSVTPKTAEQMSQCCKMPVMMVRLEMAYLKMVQTFGRKVPVPRSALLRSVLGLPEKPSPTDGEQVRALIGEK